MTFNVHVCVLKCDYRFFTGRLILNDIGSKWNSHKLKRTYYNTESAKQALIKVLTTDF